jgi:hypothetical protein
MHLPLKMPTLQEVLSFTKPRFADQSDGQRLQVQAYNQVGLLSSNQHYGATFETAPGNAGIFTGDTSLKCVEVEVSLV